MKDRNKDIKIIISGGGTGGHIFPAIAIANALKAKIKEVDILFVGALGKMEMEKVPAAGYKIIGLPVAGFRRKISLSFFITIIKLFRSLYMARMIIKAFKPDVVVGVGGYASGPVLRVATRKKIPTLIQEQNSFAGVTNKILGARANTICVAYDNMEKYFPRQKIVLAGNPVRRDFIGLDSKINEASGYFNTGPGKVLFVTGGSLGARSLNEAVLANLDMLFQNKVFVIWQAGKLYLDEMKSRLGQVPGHVMLFDFIGRMDLAYAIASVVVSRAGALSCAEIAVAAKPAILVPSPHVAEDHQTKNALAFVSKNAAIMINDAEIKGRLGESVLELMGDKAKQDGLVQNIKKLAIYDADERIAGEVIKLIKNKKIGY